MARILLAEDDDSLRGFMGRALERAGHEVTICEHGDEAIASLDDGPWDLLLTDIVMPAPRGPELADRLRAIRPDIRVIYMSGFRDTSQLIDVDRGEALFLPKPFVRSALLGTVKRAVPAGTL